MQNSAKTGGITLQGSGGAMDFQVPTTSRMQLSSSALYPTSAAGLTLGTAALRWGPGFFQGDAELIRFRRATAGGSPYLAWFNESDVGIAFIQYTNTNAMGFGVGGLGGTLLLTTTDFKPQSAGGLTLGTASLPWSAAYLGSIISSADGPL